MLTTILSGKRTYITLIAGVVGVWAVFLLGATCPAPDPTVVADASAVACHTLAGVKVTFNDAIGITWAAVAGMFGRAAIK